MNVKAILGALRAAADARLTGTATALPALNGAALAFAKQHLVPALDLPPVVLTIATGELPALEAATEPLERAALDFLKLRIDAFL